MISKLSNRENTAVPPSTYWQLVPNYNGTPAGSMWVTLPYTGNLWIDYDYETEPAAVIEVWHQGGEVTPINRGENTIAVKANDFIHYVADKICIKVAYQYI